MRLIGIDAQIPSNRIYNEDIIELVNFYSGPHYREPLQKLETTVRRFLKLTGSDTRFWRNENEKPIELLKIAVQRALKMAGITKNEINLVIYSGIDRGFIEPCNASFICRALEMNGTRCFDIVDACMGWSSAVQTAHAFFKADEALEFVMIINAEFPMDKKGTILPVNFTISELKELDWKAPSLTLGEAASACIFKRDEAINIQFEFIENSAFAHLCSIPLINHEKYLPDADILLQPDMQFYSNGAALLEIGMSSSCDVLQHLISKLDYVPDAIFPHSVSEKIIQQAFTVSKLEIKHFSTFTELGNVATVSVPSAISKALLNGNIKKGNKCIAWVASAGMKFSAIEIRL